MVEDSPQDIVGGESFGVGFVADHDPVPHHVAGEGLDIELPENSDTDRLRGSTSLIFS